MTTSALCAVIATSLAARAMAAPNRTAEHPDQPPQLQIDHVTTAVQAQLQQTDALLANGQWDDAVDQLRACMDSLGEGVVAAGEHRFVRVRDVVHRRIAALPAPALARYRSLVDAEAERWYRRAAASGDCKPLERLLRRSFCSSWGDDALSLLGAMALERGWYGRARACWQQISPELVDRDGPAGGEPTAAAASAANVGQQQAAWVFFPDTDRDLAGIRARLVLVSIRAGALERARRELATFRHRHPRAEGLLASVQGNYAATLSSVLTEAGKWPPIRALPQWLTYAGSGRRWPDWQAPIHPAALAWTARIGADTAPGAARQTPPGGLRFHPVVAGGRVMVTDERRIWAFDLATGRPAWGAPSGVVYDDGPAPTERGDRSGAMRDFRACTMTVRDNRLFARLGRPTPPGKLDPAVDRPTGHLICLDLERGAKLLWRVAPDGPNWTLAGPPLVDRANVYAVVQQSGIETALYVACFDARDGRSRWRTRIGSVPPPWQRSPDDFMPRLLTLAEGSLFFNTDLGAVAAVSCADGSIRWIHTYRRSQSVPDGPAARRRRRYPAPCVYARGRVLVAPNDRACIFALSAQTGQQLWSTRLPQPGASVLGVVREQVVVGGNRLRWLELASGKIVRQWPDQTAAAPTGFGRGTLLGDVVYWPTRKAIYMLTGRPEEKTPATTPALNLDVLGSGGGNLLAAGGYLLIARENEIDALTGPAGQAGQAGQASGGRKPPDRFEPKKPLNHIQIIAGSYGKWKPPIGRCQRDLRDLRDQERRRIRPLGPL